MRGEIWDIAVDIRVGSPTYGAWVSRTLTDAPGQALYVPPGFAHGFCALTDGAELAYKVTALYDPTDEAGIRWDDPALQIPWPVAAPLLSAKDVQLPTLLEAQAQGLLPHYAP
jgi:dTDP-4-dehydrorhamnose 3,5-epimerase